MKLPQFSRRSVRFSVLALASLMAPSALATSQDPRPVPAPKPVPRQEPARETPEASEGSEQKEKAAAPGKVAPKIQHKLRQFPSKDGLILSADLYLPNKNRKAPLIVLFHQAGWSRGEYREIAPKLCALGYNCMAVDLRSGKAVNDVPNETAARAKDAELPTEYADAIPDMEAALAYARKHLTQGKVIAWGSSYSSALALHLAGTQPKLFDGVLSFAPGEYFQKKGENWIQDAAKKIECPTFITSAKKEHPRWKAIFEAIPSKTKQAFVPTTKGNHGSRALWERFEDSPAYWKEVKTFLGKNFPVTPPKKERK